MDGKLAGLAQEAREREGWKWAEAYFDFPYGLALGRVYPDTVERTVAEAADIAALSEEYDRLVAESEDTDALPPEVDARLEEIDKALQAYGPDFAYSPDDLARSGVIVTLGYDGLARFERGLVRAEDVAPVAAEGAREASEEDRPDAREGEIDQDGESVREGERVTGAKAPLKPKHIWAIRQHLKSLGSVRDLAMFNTALDAKLSRLGSRLITTSRR